MTARLVATWEYKMTCIFSHFLWRVKDLNVILIGIDNEGPWVHECQRKAFLQDDGNLSTFRDYCKYENIQVDKSIPRLDSIRGKLFEDIYLFFTLYL